MHAFDVTVGEARLLGPVEVRALAAELDLRPTKRLGQNFVHDANTVRRIVRAADLTPDDVVLEVGPGPRLAHAGPAAGGGRRPRRRDRPGARRARCPPRSPTAPRRSPSAWSSTPPTPSASASPTRPHRDSPPTPPVRWAGAADGVGREPALQRRRAGRAAPARRAARDPAGARDGAGRGRRAARRGAGQSGVRGAERQARLVRRGAAGPGRCPGRCSGRCPASTPACSPSTGTTPPPGDRAAVFAVVDAAFAQRRKALRSALGGLGGFPGRGRGRPARGRRRSPRPRGDADDRRLRPHRRRPLARRLPAMRRCPSGRRCRRSPPPAGALRTRVVGPAPAP